MSLLAKKFRQGSFKNAAFFMEEVESDFGRRVVRHEFPKRDKPQSEDFGRKAQEFSFSCYVLGEDYEAARDKLIEACESEGKGPLIHPFLGRKQVICLGCKVSESAKENGIARFQLTFAEAGEVVFPSTGVDNKTSLWDKLSGALDAAEAAFTNNFSVIGYASQVAELAEEQVDNAMTAMDRIKKTVRGQTEAIANLTYTIRNIKANVRDLVRTPGELARQMRSAMEGLLDVLPGGDKTATRKAYESLFTYGGTFAPITPNTTNKAQQKVNQDALGSYMEQMAAGLAANEAASSDFASFEDAQLVRENITEKLDEIMEGSGSDDIFAQFQALKFETFRSVPDPSQDLSKLIKTTPSMTGPTLVLLYDLFGTIDGESDLIARNKIRNPAFVPAERELSVLKV